MKKCKMPYANVSFIHNADMPVDRILWGAGEEELKSLTIVGRKENGEICIVSSYGDVRHAYWDLSKAVAVIGELDG